MLINFIAWCIFGLVAGAIARLLVPGRDPLGCFGTIILGVAGSLVGGFLGRLLFGGDSNKFEPAGLLGAVIGGVLVLVVYRKIAARPRL